MSFLSASSLFTPDHPRENTRMSRYNMALDVAREDLVAREEERTGFEPSSDKLNHNWLSEIVSMGPEIFTVSSLSKVRSGKDLSLAT